MNVTSSGIINGIIQPQYGGRGTQFNENHIPTFSLPFKVENVPEKTVSLAIVLEDKDAYPVTSGFAWIHWLAANITRFEIRIMKVRPQRILCREEIVGQAYRVVSSLLNYLLTMAV